jgi:hypothetical protein
VWEPERVAFCRRQRSKSLGELPGTGSVNALQESSMPTGGKHEILSIGKIRRPSVTGEHHAHGQVLVDNDHRSSGMIGSVGVCLAAEERIGD